MPSLLGAIANSGAKQKYNHTVFEKSILNLDALIDCLSPRDITSETTPTQNTLEDTTAPIPVKKCGTAGEAIYRYCIGCLRK